MNLYVDIGSEYTTLLIMIPQINLLIPQSFIFRSGLLLAKLAKLSSTNTADISLEFFVCLFFINEV